LKLLEQDKPELWAVLTYADKLEGHIGYIYQATNAIYTGISMGADRYVTPDGKIKGTYINGHGIRIQQAEDWGWTRIKAEGKHRYVYLLGNKSERRQRNKALLLPRLEYPK
jgi:hypothetical protein